MNTELRELYQQMIVDHSKHPRNFEKPEHFSHSGVGHNPLCGDKIIIFATLKGEIIEQVCFHGSGCAISTASASMMSEILKGKTIEQAELLFHKFHALVTGKEMKDTGPDLGKLSVFAGVAEFPSRVKCASLAWHTIHNTLLGNEDVAKTE